MKRFLWHILLLCYKDILLELRSREVTMSSVIFAMLVLLVFNFSMDVTPQTVERASPSIMWITFIFTGVLAMSRAFVHEKDKGTLEGLLLCPISRDSLFFGKMLSIFLFMVTVQLVVLPVFSILFNFSVFSFDLIIVILLANLGFALVGTLFAAMAVNTRSRETILPILFFPVVIPIIIGAVEASKDIIWGRNDVSFAGNWILFIAVFDAIFIVTCPWLFTFIMEE